MINCFNKKNHNQFQFWFSSVTFLLMKWVSGESPIYTFYRSHQFSYTSLDEEGFGGRSYTCYRSHQLSYISLDEVGFRWKCDTCLAKNKKKQTKKTHQKKPVTDHTNSVTFLSMRWVLGEGVIPGSHQLIYTSLDEEGFRWGFDLCCEFTSTLLHLILLLGFRWGFVPH